MAAKKRDSKGRFVSTKKKSTRKRAKKKRR
jgi:hypothetical protein